jgi:hypothetical protein
MKRPPFDTATLDEIFKFDSDNDERLSSRESGRLEFKESFHLGSADDYAKTMAAFANASGGYLVYGVQDKPRTLIGLKSDAFDSLDPAKLTQTLNSILAPEIQWEPLTYVVNGKKVGVIYIHEASTKPVLCLKSTKEVQEGAIYYRYRGRSEKIRYPELRQLLDNERQKERELWTHTLQQMARIGIENVGILNSISGEVSGKEGSFLISEELLPKIQFIHSGTFVESGGQPTLRIVGEAVPINSQLVQPNKLVRTPLHGPDIINAFLRRESVLTPLDYVKQICFEQSHFYPVHFFINQTNIKIEDVISELEQVACRASTKSKLILRLRTNENLTYGSLGASSPAGMRRNQIFSSLVSKALSDIECESNLADFFHSLTYLTRDNADPEFILPLIQRVAMPKYFTLPALVAGSMRKAICHLDLIWYRRSNAKGVFRSLKAPAPYGPTSKLEDTSGAEAQSLLRN